MYYGGKRPTIGRRRISEISWWNWLDSAVCSVVSQAKKRLQQIHRLLSMRFPRFLA
jgi:hypothetical protein